MSKLTLPYQNILIIKGARSNKGQIKDITDYLDQTIVDYLIHTANNPLNSQILNEYPYFDLFILIGTSIDDSSFFNNTNIILIDEDVTNNCEFIYEFNCLYVKRDVKAKEKIFSEIIKESIYYLYGKSKGKLENLNVLITSGGTSELIDPVRVITNKSSGKMGKALAYAMICEGANVTYLTSRSSVSPPIGCRVEYYYSTSSLKEKTLELAKKSDVLIMTAAVSDFKVKKVSKGKLKKDLNTTSLDIEKIDNFIYKLPANLLKIGFAAETEISVNKTIEKMKNRGFNYICLNDVSTVEAGFDSDFNKVNLLNKSGSLLETQLSLKEEIAKEIVQKLLFHFRELIREEEIE